MRSSPVFETPRRLMEHAAQAIERARTSYDRGEPFDRYVRGDLLEARELIDVALHDLEEHGARREP
jgi:hypothetical protein